MTSYDLHLIGAAVLVGTGAGIIFLWEREDSGAKQHGMHDPARRDGEQPGDHQCTEKDGDHRPAMSFHAMAAGMHHGERKHDQSEDRQEVDRAERADHAQIVDEERASGNEHHQHDPNPADGTMGDRALWGDQLNGAKQECSHGRESVDLDDRRSVKKRS